MPEIEECRYCAKCCRDCIFLEYDNKEKKFKCLIYKNKYRLPIYYDWSHLYGFKNFEEELITFLEEMITIKRRKNCDTFICYTLQVENKVDRDIRTDKLTKRDILSLRRVRYARKRRIPNFENLVEILNS